MKNTILYVSILIAYTLTNMPLAGYTRTISSELSNTYSNRDLSKFSRLSSKAPEAMGKLRRFGKFIAIVPTDSALTDENGRDTPLYSFLQKTPELAKQSITDFIFDLDKEENKTVSGAADQLDAAFNESGLWLDNIGNQTGATLCKIAGQYGQLTLISISNSEEQNIVEASNGILYKTNSHIISSNLFEKLPADIQKQIKDDIKNNAPGAPVIIYTLPEDLA